MNKEKLAKSVGVCTHFESCELGWKVDNLLPILKDLGAGHVRQEIKWEWVEQQKGVYEIPALSMDWVDKVSRAGLGILLILDYGNPIYENPLDADGFAAYAGFMAERLKDYPIIAYEIWNEPTNFFFYEQYGGTWSGKESSIWLEKFQELISKSAEAIRKADPTATIITNPGEPQFFHLAEKYPVAFKEIDGVSHHPYPVQLPPESLPLGGGEISADHGIVSADDNHSFLSLFRRTQEQGQKCFGKTLKLFSTEFGFSTYNPAEKPGWAAGYNEFTQACFMTRAVILNFVAGVESPCIYNLMDDGIGRDECEENFGLVRNEKRNYEPKPSYVAIKRLIELLGDDWEFVPEPPVKLQLPEQQFYRGLNWRKKAEEPFILIDGPLLYWFKKGDQFLCFFWKAGRINGETPAPFARLNWEHAPDVKPVKIQDVVSGEDLPVCIETPRRMGEYSMRLILTDLPVRPSPVAILWQSSKSDLESK